MCMIIVLAPVNSLAATITTSKETKTAVDVIGENVTKILNYQEQLRKANIKSDLSSERLLWDIEDKHDN